MSPLVNRWSVPAALAAFALGCVEPGAPPPYGHAERDANLAPAVTVNQVLVVDEGGSAPITSGELTVEDGDDGPEALRLTLDEAPAKGEVLRYGAPVDVGGFFTMGEVDAGEVAYRHDGSESTEDAFSFTARDPLGAAVGGEFLVAVTPVNDAPVAFDDAYATDADTALVVDPADGVVANDADAEGDALGALLFEDVGNGTLALSADGGFTYTPADGFTGWDRFGYQPVDGPAVGNPAAVVVAVGLAPELPVDTGPVDPPSNCVHGPSGGAAGGWVALAGLAMVRRRTVRPCRSR